MSRLFLHQAPIMFYIDWRSGSDSAIRTASSAYSRIETVSSPVLPSLPKASILKARSLIYRLKRRGESEQACFNPHFTLNQSVVNPLFLTEHKTLLYTDLIAYNSYPFKSSFSSFVQRISLLTVSYAFLKSINAQNADFLCFFLVSIILINELIRPKKYPSFR